MTMFQLNLNLCEEKEVDRMLAPILLGGRSRKLILIRFGFLGVLLVVTFVFHVSGTALVELQIARLVLLVALVVGFALISRRRRRDAAESSSADSET